MVLRGRATVRGDAEAGARGADEEPTVVRLAKRDQGDGRDARQTKLDAKQRDGSAAPRQGHGEQPAGEVCAKEGGRRRRALLLRRVQRSRRGDNGLPRARAIAHTTSPHRIHEQWDVGARVTVAYGAAQ